jgi:hypothetical protein
MTTGTETETPRTQGALMAELAGAVGVLRREFLKVETNRVSTCVHHVRPEAPAPTSETAVRYVGVR